MAEVISRSTWRAALSPGAARPAAGVRDGSGSAPFCSPARPRSVRVLGDRGLQVFLDLKWHDLPNTVAESVVALGGSAWRWPRPHAGRHGRDSAPLHGRGFGLGWWSWASSVLGDLARCGVVWCGGGPDRAWTSRTRGRAIERRSSGVRPGGGGLRAGRDRARPPVGWVPMRRSSYTGIRGRTDAPGDQVRGDHREQRQRRRGPRTWSSGVPSLLAADAGRGVTSGCLEEARCIGS